MMVNVAKLIYVTQLVSLQPMLPESNKMPTNQVKHALADFARSNMNMY